MERGMDTRPTQTDAGLEALFDFSFRRFLTLNVMKVLYVLGLVLIALGWLIAVITGCLQGGLQGIMTFALVSIIAMIYVIFLRVWLELIVVIFRIGENVGEIARGASAGAGTGAGGGGGGGGAPMPPPPQV
jgi:uncharacterized membrane protein YgcG